MNEGEIVLTRLEQADGASKLRPALVLRLMPPFGDRLVCGISTQLHQAVLGFDEVIYPNADNGLKSASVLRLGYLQVVPENRINGGVGAVPKEVLQKLVRRLADYLTENEQI